MNVLNEDDLVDVPDFIMTCPVCAHWVEYRGETYFGMINYEMSIRKGRAVIDLAYCATQAMNDIFLKTVDYSKRMTISKLNA